LSAGLSKCMTNLISVCLVVPLIAFLECLVLPHFDVTAFLHACLNWFLSHSTYLSCTGICLFEEVRVPHLTWFFKKFHD
jgi:hypothetical protein